MSVTQSANPVPATSAGTFEIDPQHSTVGFKVRHMMISNVKGDFRKFSGTVSYDPQSPLAAEINISIDAASINTGEPQRDDHLRSADFFDVAKHPELTFKSKRVTPSGEDNFKVAGDLTIHGVTREVTLTVETTPQVKDPWGGTRFGASATAKINRKDFGLTWNQALELGGVLVGDEVQIAIEVELVKKAA
jgi:polyisoprenoid-binding protein YceI